MRKVHTHRPVRVAFISVISTMSTLGTEIAKNQEFDLVL